MNDISPVADEAWPAVSGVNGGVGCIPRRSTEFPEEHAEIAEMNWCTHYVQLSPGLFHGSLFDAASGGVTVGLEDYNLPMEEMFSAPPDTFFYARARTTGEAFCEGVSLGHDFGIICTDEALLHFLAKGKYSGSYVAVASTLIDTLMPDFDWRTFMRRARWRFVAPRRSIGLDSVVDGFLACVAAEGCEDGMISLSRDVALEAAALVASTAGRWDARPASHTRTYVFRKAREYIFDRLDEDIAVSDICDALRVSERTLEYSFNDVASISPKRYILTHKLNRVRSDIVKAKGSADLTELSFKWGFNHPSRFAQQYKRHFLELPSETRLRVGQYWK